MESSEKRKVSTPAADTLRLWSWKVRKHNKLELNSLVHGVVLTIIGIMFKYNSYTCTCMNLVRSGNVQFCVSFSRDISFLYDVPKKTTKPVKPGSGDPSAVRVADTEEQQHEVQC